MQCHTIPCSSITASSVRNFRHKACKVRLSSGLHYYKPTWTCCGWSPSPYDIKPWLQIYLRHPHIITGVVTQGGCAKRALNSVTAGYKMSYSMDGNTWIFYRTVTGAIKNFSGDANPNTVVMNVIRPVITAIYVRIHPVTWTGVQSLRVKLYGCVDVNECQSNPCRNGATCNNLVQNYSCTCIAGFTGKNCEHNIDDCKPDPCINGGTCFDLVNDFKCACRPGWMGKICQTNLGPDCTCVNGATCTDTVDGFRCICRLGFTGKNCELNINECESKPCRNGGTCSDLVNDYKCACRPGYVGKHCEIDLGPDCTCVIGATCTDTVDGFRCICRPGFTGKNCELKMDELING
ncbi:fibropellin-3-like isoform X2 [Actinia tenebrosa]|nr:fibropellin-3-like isoform X2 [Actinia tenebrosa]